MGRTGGRSKKAGTTRVVCVSHRPERRGGGRGYFFLFAAALALVACCAVMSAFFFWFAPSAFDCFCEACFCTDFGDRSPMVVVLSLGWLTFGMFVSPTAWAFVGALIGQSEPYRPDYGCIDVGAVGRK